MAELRCDGPREVLRDPRPCSPTSTSSSRGHADRDPRRLGQRQDDAPAPDHRLHRGRRGDVTIGGSVVARRRKRERRRRQARDRLRRTGGGAVPAPDASPRTSPSACPAPSASVGAASARRSTSSASTATTPAGARTSSRAASSAGSRSRGRSPRARALVLLDEPFSGARRRAPRRDARGGRRRARRGEGTTAVLVTHDQAEALSMGREVAVLRGGPARPDGHARHALPRPCRSRRGALRRRRGGRAGRRGPGTVDCALGRLAVRGAAVDGPVAGDDPARADPARRGERRCAAEVVGHGYYGAETVVRLVLGRRLRDADRRQDASTRTSPRGATLVHVRRHPGPWPRFRRNERATAGAPLRARAPSLACDSLAGCGGSSGPSIVLYNGQHPQLTQALVAAFEKQTGITVHMRTNDSVVLADQLL